MALSITPISSSNAAQAAARDVALQPGTVVTGQVLKLLDANLVRLAIAGLTLDVATTSSLQPGQTLQFAVIQGENGISLAPVLPEPTTDLRGGAVVLDEIPLAPKLPAPAETIRPALSPVEARAVSVASQVAATKQNGLSPLFANLTTAVTSGNLPQPILVAAVQLFDLRRPSDRVLTGADVKAALASSGLVLEASLASNPSAAMPDMKAALTVLRQTLATWLDQRAAEPIMRAPRGPAPDEPAPSARNSIPPPPFRDALPAAQSVAAPSLTPDAEPVVVVRQLIADTDGALARQTLLQIASLPDRIDVANPKSETTQPRWNFEIPFVTPQGTAMAQFAISRDGSAHDVESMQRVWRARFSLHIEPAGPVHALISFSGDMTSVKMWAERPATAAQLRANAMQLGASLAHAELKTGDIVVADGAPARAQAPSAGHFLNRAS